MENVKKLRFHGCVVVEPRGKSRGMALLWRDNVDVDFINYSSYHISVSMMLTKQQPLWILIGFYGHPEAHKGKLSWQLLSTLIPNIR